MTSIEESICRQSDAFDTKQGAWDFALSQSDRKWKERGLHILQVKFHLFLPTVFSSRDTSSSRRLLNT